MNWIEIRQENFDYYLRYQIPRTTVDDALKAAHDTIRCIVQNYPPPYTLMLSGGIDSQAMLFAWHTSDVPFKTFSAVYNNGLNENDLCTLREFSEKHSININFINFDLLSFLQNEHVNYVHKYRCGSPHMTTFMKLSELITEGTTILSGNFMPNNIRLPISKNNFGLYRFSKLENKPMVPFFFCETQELAFAFKLKTEMVKQHSVKKAQLVTDTDELGYLLRTQRYLDNNFPVIPQKHKMTGFELVKDYYDEHFRHLITPRDKMMINGRQHSKRTFDLLLRNKYEFLFNSDKFVITPYYNQ